MRVGEVELCRVVGVVWVRLGDGLAYRLGDGLACRLGDGLACILGDGLTCTLDDVTLPYITPPPWMIVGAENTETDGSRSTTWSRLIICWMAAVSTSPSRLELIEPDLLHQTEDAPHTKHWKRWKTPIRTHRSTHPSTPTCAE